MMNDIQTTCPHCGAEVDNYFEDTTPDEWTITTPFPNDCAKIKYGDDFECTKKSHTQYSYAEYEIYCPECDNPIWFTCHYAQPCNANGYVTDMTMTLHPSPTADTDPQNTATSVRSSTHAGENE